MATLSSQLISVQQIEDGTPSEGQILLVSNQPGVYHLEKIKENDYTESMIQELLFLMQQAEIDFEIGSSIKLVDDTLVYLFFRLYTIYPSEKELTGLESLLEMVTKSIEIEMEKYFKH